MRHKTTYLGALVPLALSLNAQSKERPNIVIIMTDQQRADLCAREGYNLDLTPFADQMACEGAWFDKAYTPCPASGPARVAVLTGRFPKATRTDSNHNIADATFGEDLFTTASKAGYLSVLVGKNHSHMSPTDADYWIPYNHLGQEGPSSAKTEEDKAFDQFLGKTDFYASMEPSPYGLEHQLPYRMVTDALKWTSEHKDSSFVMWLSFAEPHNPYQVCEPYYSMFEGQLKPADTDASSQEIKGEKFTQLAEMMGQGHKGYEENLERLRANYMGMIRLLDDQMRRFVKGMEEQGLFDDTIFVITSDHGDFAGEYGLMKKGAGVPDMLTRVPMIWFGGGLPKSGLRNDHVSLVDIYPTVCELMGQDIPLGVQGRSLLPMLSGQAYPKEEFGSIFSQTGFGGQYYTKEDDSDYIKEGASRRRGYFFDELNTWSQSGTISMVRKGDWKLSCDMLGNCELYNLSKDPAEIHNLYGKRRWRRKTLEMTQELLKWEIATIDPLPVPRQRYYFKRLKHNYLFTEE